MKRRKQHRKKPTAAQQQQVNAASQTTPPPAFGLREEAVDAPEEVKESYAGLTAAASGWSPYQQAVEPASYQTTIGMIPHSVNQPAGRVTIELYVENSTQEVITLHHVVAKRISVLVENSQILPGQTRRAVMIMEGDSEADGKSDGFMFCQGSMKNQCIVKCAGQTLWVALQSGEVNPVMHDMTAFSHTAFDGKRYLLCFNPPYKTH